MKRGVRGSCTGGAITRGWGGLRDTGDRRTAGPAQPIMVESEHPLDDPRGVGRAVHPPPTGPDDPVEVGPYRVLGRLGAGGMGTVYLAESPAGARVAIKVIRPELAGDVAFLDRFRREVGAARRVAGFCTAQVLDANLDGTAPYLVTEYVDGVRLDLVVERDGPLAASNLEGLAVGVAAALAGIHAAEVVHRDLKPGNVLLSYFGPRVIDFGIARALDDASTAITRVGTVMGTPAWMAPEQFGNAPVTTAADIFAWGGLVAYAGTGRLAFGRGPVEVLAYRIVHQPPDLDGLAEPLRPLVELAMAKDPPGGRAPATCSPSCSTTRPTPAPCVPRSPRSCSAPGSRSRCGPIPRSGGRAAGRPPSPRRRAPPPRRGWRAASARVGAAAEGTAASSSPATTREGGVPGPRWAAHRARAGRAAQASAGTTSRPGVRAGGGKADRPGYRAGTGPTNRLDARSGGGVAVRAGAGAADGLGVRARAERAAQAGGSDAADGLAVRAGAGSADGVAVRAGAGAADGLGRAAAGRAAGAWEGAAPGCAGGPCHRRVRRACLAQQR